MQRLHHAPPPRFGEAVSERLAQRSLASSEPQSLTARLYAVLVGGIGAFDFGILCLRHDRKKVTT